MLHIHAVPKISLSEVVGFDRTAVTFALAVSRSNHLARSHPCTTWLYLIQPCVNLIHTRLDLIHTWLDFIHPRLNHIYTWLDLIHTWLDLIHTRLDLIQTRLTVKEG